METSGKQLEENEEGEWQVNRIREERHPGFQISPSGDRLCEAQGLQERGYCCPGIT